MTALWNPVEVLSIRQERDGHFICSGVKNGTTTPCGYHLRGDVVGNINRLADEMSANTPRDAIPNLNQLAKLTLCHNHQKTQVRTKVAEWTSIIKGIPNNHENSFTPASSLPPTSTASNRAYEAPEVVKYPRLSDGRTTEERIQSMQEDINRLKEQMNRLEVIVEDKSAVASPKDSRRSSIARIFQGKGSSVKRDAGPTITD